MPFVVGGGFSLARERHDCEDMDEAAAPAPATEVPHINEPLPLRRVQLLGRV